MANETKQVNQIRAPYNFVPLNKQVFIPGWCDRISQDVPFSDGEDGTIEVTLHNTTPLYIKNGMDENSPMAYVDDHGIRRYFLPATSIKGMLRSVLEILTFSQMDTFDDDYIGYREFHTKSPLHKEYSTAMAEVRCGWLYAVNEDTIWIDDCGEPETISLSEKINNIPVKNLPTGSEIGGKILIQTGEMRGKNVAYLFPKEGGFRKPVEKSVFEKFLSVYKPSPVRQDETYLREDARNNPKAKKDDVIRAALRKGRRLPVFFTQKNGDVVFIGLSRQFRYPMKYSISAGVRHEGISCPIDMAKCIFGYTLPQHSLRGRVQIGHAFCKENIENFETKRGVLGQPHPSFYPLYVKQDSNGSFKTYNNEGYEIAGRKRYRVHADNAITQIPQGNNKENVMTTLSLLPRGNSFSFKIHLHNLRPAETGAILSALTFHGTKSCHHVIGMGKSYGYGKLEIDEIVLRGLDRSVKEYMQVFETCMTKFNSQWLQSPQLCMLRAIAEDHGVNDNIGTMELAEFRNYKNNNNYYLAKLQESVKAITSLVTPLEAKRNKMLTQYKEAQQLNSDGKFEEALEIYSTIQKVLFPIVDPEVEEMILRLQSQVDDLRQQQQAKAQAEREQQAAAEKTAAQERIQNMTFAQFLEGVKMSSPAAFKGKIEREWVDVRGALTDEEKNLVKMKVETYLSDASKKEQKRWSGFTI